MFLSRLRTQPSSHSSHWGKLLLSQPKLAPPQNYINELKDMFVGKTWLCSSLLWSLLAWSVCHMSRRLWGQWCTISICRPVGHRLVFQSLAMMTSFPFRMFILWHVFYLLGATQKSAVWWEVWRQATARRGWWGSLSGPPGCVPRRWSLPGSQQYAHLCETYICIMALVRHLSWLDQTQDLLCSKSKGAFHFQCTTQNSSMVVSFRTLLVWWKVWGNRKK